MLELSICDLCGGMTFLKLYEKVIQYEKPWSDFIESDKFPLKIRGCICNRCGWIFQNPTYSSDEFDKLYNFRSETISEEANRMATFNTEKRSKELFNFLQKWIKADTCKILDVGGRNGELMEPFSNKGYQVTSIDMDGGEPFTNLIRKIRLPFCQYSNEQFDILTMLHVLEHTESPHEFLQHAHKLIKDDGLLFIEVPFEILTPLFLRHVGDHRHLGYFTAQTLIGFLKSSSFTILYCKMEKGFVGSTLPVIRAVARKTNSCSTWKPSDFMFIRSLAAAFHFLPMYLKIINHLKNTLGK